MIYKSMGSVKIRGCASINVKKNFFVYFEVGSRAYIKKKAKYGILESVVLKKVYRTEQNKPIYNGIQPVVSYVDTLNRVWMENELTYEAEAIDYAKLYWRSIEKDAQELFDQGYCL